MAVKTSLMPSMPARRSRGAALLLAMMIVALVSTMAAAMVWQQWRAVQVEKVERARRQSDWILTGALNWARLILREDAKSGGPDHLGEPWAVPLAEARLSTFLAADKNNTDVELEAFLSGSMTDAQSRYNLLNLVNKEGSIDPKELSVVKNLFDHINVPRELATVIANSLQGGIPANPAPAPAQGTGTSTASTNPPAAPPPPVNTNPTVLPHSLMQLAWFGLDPDTLRRIEPFVILLPSNGTPTTVNLNTASREVLAAVIDGLDLGTAERLIQARQRNPFKSIDDAQKQLPSTVQLNREPVRVGFQSRFFETRGRMRLEDRVLEQRTLVQRFGNNVKPIFHELINASAGP